MAIKSWDIFCRVVDNYGDIGVCWRLARQLANEYHHPVRLWVDELAALKQIYPGASLVEQQVLEKVEVCYWQQDLPTPTVVADVVVEAFACDLPKSYLLAMKARPTPPHWFNLEYLSAENWVEDCHGLVSVHPRLGLKKVFFFPGFTARTGGLIRESNLLENCQSYLKDPVQIDDFYKNLGVSPLPGELVVSLFGYENAALPFLLDHWVHSKTPLLCLVPASKVLPNISQFADRTLGIGDEFARGSLRLKVIPFLTQTDYDHLLWISDVNFVRGEDSFVRAQWAGKPFVWHIYPQDDQVHLEKLNAFLELFLSEHPPGALNTETVIPETRKAEALNEVRQLWLAWNHNEDPGAAWAAAQSQLETWRNHCENWRQHLNSLGDLASNMVHFCQKTI